MKRSGWLDNTIQYYNNNNNSVVSSWTPNTSYYHSLRQQQQLLLPLPTHSTLSRGLNTRHNLLAKPAIAPSYRGLSLDTTTYDENIFSSWRIPLATANVNSPVAVAAAAAATHGTSMPSPCSPLLPLQKRHARKKKNFKFNGKFQKFRQKVRSKKSSRTRKSPETDDTWILDKVLVVAPGAATPTLTTAVYGRSQQRDLTQRLSSMEHLLKSQVDYIPPGDLLSPSVPVAAHQSSGRYNVNSKPFLPPPQDTMTNRMQRKLAAAARFCRDNPKAPLHKMLSIVPKISSFRFAEAIAIAMKCAEPGFGGSGDFSAIELFKVSEGSATIRTQDARDLFELLFVGLGAFPVGCDNLEWNLEPIVNKNSSNLVVDVGYLPGDEKSNNRALGPQKLLQLASEEVTAKRYLGPFTLDEARAMFKQGIVVSSSFLISKPGAITTKYRLVHNASSLHGNINESINSAPSSYKVRLDHTSKYMNFVRTQLQEAAGAPIFQVVCDVSKCYRRMKVRTSDVPRYGLRCDIVKDETVPFYSGDGNVTTKSVRQGQMVIYFDTCLPFGSTSSVDSCVRVTNYLRDVQRELMLSGTCAVYIDDFCLVGTKKTIDTAVASLRGLMERVGLPENVLKQQLVSQISEFLGVTYDYTGDNPTVSIPKKKVMQYLRHVNYFLDRNTNSITKNELESLVGKLAHVATIIAHAKIFYQRLLAALRNCAGRHKNTIVNLGKPEMDDLRWWQRVLTLRNSNAIVLQQDGYDHKIYTDASTSTGYGVMFRGEYFHGEWSEEIKLAIAAGTVDINALELVCLTMALETFATVLRGSRVLFRCDNSSCVFNVTKETSQKSLRAAILRRLYVVAVLYDITISSSWISTHDNKHADSLSRSDFVTFYALPQHFPLSKVVTPCLQSLELLTDPMGPQNPSSPAWLNSHEGIMFSSEPPVAH